MGYPYGTSGTAWLFPFNNALGILEGRGFSVHTTLDGFETDFRAGRSMDSAGCVRVSKAMATFMSVVMPVRPGHHPATLDIVDRLFP